MLNLYELYKKMKDEDIVLAFNGVMSEDLLSSVFQMMDIKSDDNPQDLRRKKKVNNILVECLQNIYHHGDDLTGEKSQGSQRTVMFLICKSADHHYRIITGNHMLRTSVNGLKEKIDKVNDLSSEELKTLYRDLLSSTELSEKGGAGLGIIDLVRKSGNKITYQFVDVNDEFSFFTLIITVD